MFESELNLMREKIRLRQYVMTIHADEEADDDNLTIYDIENAILTGKIVERQKDRETSESKYLIRGKTVDGIDIITVVNKFSFTGKLIIITVYVE
jgi:hypothetical protein